MSYEMVELVLAHVDAAPAAKMVDLVLARHADSKGVAWPTIETISEYTQLTDRYVRKCLRDLERDGYLRVLRNGHVTPTHRYTNVYQLLVPDCACPRDRRGRPNHRPGNLAVADTLDLNLDIDTDDTGTEAL